MIQAKISKKADSEDIPIKKMMTEETKQAQEERLE